MKNILKYAYLLLAFAGIVSCTEKEPVWVEPTKTMSIEEANLVFQPSGGTSSFLVKAENSFTAAADRDWCTVSVSGSQVEVSVTGNSSNETRYSRITLTSGNETLGITVHQYGLVIKGFNVGDVAVSSRGKSIEYPYQTNGVLTVTSDYPWIKVEQTDGLVRITVEPNDGASRTGEVKYRLGDIENTFTIAQSGSFKEYSSWVPGYAGKEYDNSAVLCEVFGVTADAQAAAETYTISVVPASEVSAAGLPMNAYVEDVVYPAALASLKQKAEEDGCKLEELLLKGTKAAYFPAENYPAGSYCVFAIGMDGNGNPTGNYAEAEISTKAVAYNWWIGTWKVTDGNGTVSTVTIAQKENGKSYTVTGLGGFNFALNANFNADGTFTLTGSSTENITTVPYTNGTYVYSTLNLLGLYTVGSSSYYRTGATIDVALGSKTADNKAKVTGYLVSSGGSFYKFLQLVYRGKASNAGAAEANTVLKRNYLPLALVKQ